MPPSLRREVFSQPLSPRRKALESFYRETRAILDETRLTHAWTLEELPPLGTNQSAHVLRGPLAVMAKWRGAFWRRAIAGLLRLFPEGGDTQAAALFDQGRFESIWLALPLLSEPPPIAPSIHKPSVKAPAYARGDEYREWANQGYRERLARVSPAFREALGQAPYDPEDRAAFHRHARLLSGVCAWLTTEKLGRYGDSPEALARYFETDGELKIRYRASDDNLWPGRRPYVDLRLRPIHAQVLEHRPGDWEDTAVLRCLPLKEAATVGSEQNIKHSKLTRLDIELALWCDLAGRLAQALAAHAIPPAEPGLPDHQPMNAYRRLLPYQVPLAQAMVEAIRRLERRPPAMPRFSTAGLTAGATETAEIPGAGFSLLPPDLATPVLEDDRLYCQLDWERIVPHGDWMDLRLLLLPGDGGEPQYLEFEEIEGEETCLRLQGPAWEGPPGRT